MKRSVSSTRNPWSFGALVIVVIIAVIGASPNHARAARVSGVLTGYENSTPPVSRDLHFQNVITGDSYLSHALRWFVRRHSAARHVSAPQ